MKPYLHKLQGETLCYRYAVNNVYLGIKWAIIDKEVMKYPDKVEKLKKLLEAVKKFPPSYRLLSDIDYAVISETIRIKEEAYDLICNI
jgi:hypothetical protein